jgi:hypothetical protein
MPWFSKLLSFIDKVFSLDVSINRHNSPNIKIKAHDSIIFIHNQDKEPYSTDKNGEHTVINVAKLNEEQKAELRSIIKESYEEEGELLKENLLRYSGELDEYKEENPDKELLDYFRNKLSREDFEILRISLFLRSRYRLKENVSHIKSDILKRFGDRGKNIANLCSAGYFESFVQPLYEAIHESIENKTEAEQKFNEIFELIVRNGLLAVFVHSGMTEGKLASQIMKKMEESKRYGFAMVSDQLYIHALSSQNVNTVLKWIEKNGTEISAEVIAKGSDFITVSIPISDLSLDNFEDSS